MTILTVDAKTLEVGDVRCTDTDLVITLRDGRRITAPLWWYPRLSRATEAARSRWEIAGAGRGIHWPDIDEDVSLEGLLRGAKDPHAMPPATQEKTSETTTSYYVNQNAQANGDHEVHTEECIWLPAPENRIYLGDFSSCGPAVREARKHYSQVNGCFHCSSACHTT